MVVQFHHKPVSRERSKCRFEISSRGCQFAKKLAVLYYSLLIDRGVLGELGVSGLVFVGSIRRSYKRVCANILAIEILG